MEPFDKKGASSYQKSLFFFFLQAESIILLQKAKGLSLFL